MKEKRQYGLFEKQDGKWIRLHPQFSAVKSTAVRVFQDLLLTGTLAGKERELRPIKQEVITMQAFWMGKVMTTWWIVRLPTHKDGMLTITAYRQQRSVGPYWSVEEALKMIKKWR